MADKRISKEKVQHIAQLCNLNLSSAEIEKLSKTLTETIDYINVLNGLDTKDVEETYQVTGMTNVYQKDDEEQTTLLQKDSLANAGEVVKNMFATKAVFDR